MEENNKEILRLNQLTHNEKGEVLIVHRRDDKKIVHAKKPLTLTGVISAPGNFIEKRTDQDEKDRVHVLFSKNQENLFIELVTRENHPLSYRIKGTLEKNPDIAMMRVNTKKTSSVKELSELLKFNRFFFPDKDQNMAIVSNLQKFRVSAQTFIEKEDANRGNEKDIYEIKGAETNIDLTFDLMMPLFKGQPAKKFKVEILYRIRERNVEVWLESAELAELYRAEAEGIIDTELKRFPKEFVFIEQ